MNRSIRLTALTLLALPVASAFAGTYTYSGTTVGGPTFNRPLANGASAPTGLSGVGTAVSYSALTFTVDTAGSYTFQSTAVLPANWDNYTVLYSPTFVPSNGLTNVKIANDDNTTIGLSGFAFNLAPATAYVLVTTGFGNTDAGSFSNTITGPGNITPVPEPGSLAALSLVGLAVVRRRRR